MPPTNQLSDIATVAVATRATTPTWRSLRIPAPGFAWLRDHLTAERVAAYFAPLGPSKVERFEASNVLGLNFVLRDVLAGGASQSLRTDTQGKTLALALLQMSIELPADHAAMLRSRA